VEINIWILTKEEDSDACRGSEVSVFGSLEEASAALEKGYKKTIDALPHDKSLQEKAYSSKLASNYAYIMKGREVWSWRIEKRRLIIPTPATVPVDEAFGEMLNWAIRYSLGRRTYAAADTANYVRGLVRILDTRTLRVAKEDICKAPSLGHEVDAYYWRGLLEAIEEELQNRADKQAQGD